MFTQLFIILFLVYANEPFLSKARLHFKYFLRKFPRPVKYSQQELEARFQFFQDNLKTTIALNSLPNTTSVWGITKFSAFSPEEISRLKGRRLSKTRGRRKRKSYRNIRPWDGMTCKSCVRFPHLRNVTIPEEWDWVSKGAVSEPEDQGLCGNCFAFAAAGDVEGAWFLAGHPFRKLSVQQITSCDRVGEDDGCEGATSNKDTFAYIQQNGGLSSASIYPLNPKTPTTGQSFTCDVQKAQNFTAKIQGSLQISGDGVPINVEATKRALFLLGPMTAGMNADNLQFYDSGVIKLQSCHGSWDDLDHQVMLVGYGIDEKEGPYWKVKNSWGHDWGEGGYFRVQRDEKNLCGLATDVVHSIV